jgi:ankyrin repeat protein
VPRWRGSASFSDPRRNSPGSYGGIFNVSPLHWAACGGSVEVANLLISRGESPSAKDSQSHTPLFWAAARGQAGVAQLLVKHGAEVNARDFFGSTPLLTATRGAVAPELVKFLVEAGAQVNARDSSGENPLHKLAWFGYPEKNVETAQILLDAGADIIAKNSEGQTPLDVLLANDYRNGDLVNLYRAYTARKRAAGVKR